ncbi:MAG: hypothetical protein H0W61_12680 [Bacteroidetes bacterium]|nr:hypothetical protein [Bacteroidota bacterium]
MFARVHTMLLLPAVFFFSPHTGTAAKDSTLCRKLKPSTETSLVQLSAAYKLPVNKSSIINSGHGLSFEAGINLARFFSKKSIVGVYGGWAWMDRLWNTSFNKNFVNDYQANLNQESGLQSLDSSVANSFTKLISEKRGSSVTLPGCEMNSFHNYSLYYGITLKIPYTWSPILKIYTGFTRTHFQGAGNIATIGKDYNIFQLRRSMYGAELILFRGLQSVTGGGEKYPRYKNTGTLSIYYEACDFSNAAVYFGDGINHTSVSLKKFVSAPFLNKYKAERYLGLKLSFSIL